MLTNPERRCYNQINISNDEEQHTSIRYGEMSALFSFSEQRIQVVLRKIFALKPRSALGRFYLFCVCYENDLH